MKLKFNYSKLRALLVENDMTLRDYAKIIGISYVSLNSRLQNEIYFSQSEIYKTANHFKLNPKSINDIFFTI